MVQGLGVRKSYGAVEVLKGVNLSVARGSVSCLIGPSGSGKSTFLRYINHFEKHDSGELLVDDQLVGYRLHNDKLYERTEKSICKERAEIGMVFQRFNLFAHRTALENIMMAPVKVRRQSFTAARVRAMEPMDRVGLTDKASSYPSQLSGAQQQRVAIARALAMDLPFRTSGE